MCVCGHVYGYVATYMCMWPRVWVCGHVYGYVYVALPFLPPINPSPRPARHSNYYPQMITGRLKTPNQESKKTANSTNSGNAKLSRFAFRVQFFGLSRPGVSCSLASVSPEVSCSAERETFAFRVSRSIFGRKHERETRKSAPWQ